MRTECIDGPGERTRLGYVRLWNGGNRILAHRKAWIDQHGDIPSGMELDHLCRNRWCRNVLHLELVTHAENMRRTPSCKLTLSQVEEIKRLRSQGATLREIGDKFGVTRQAIFRITKGLMWK